MFKYNKKVLLIAFFGAILFLTGCFNNKSVNKSASDGLLSNKQEQTVAKNNTSDPSDNSNQKDVQLGKNDKPAITLSEIAKHDSADDCWFAIDGKVYNVTSYIASQKHPGKSAILAGCGKDATELFKTRPMGSGTPHSVKAQTAKENFYIGKLAQ